MKRAIVVGATSGIGLEVARLLAREGWQVGIAGRRENLLQAIQAEHANIVATATIDITSATAADALLTLVERLGGMDLYFHSSGIGWQNPDLDLERELRTVETNALGFTRMVNAAFQYFASRPDTEGHIAVISSIAATRGLGAAPAYSASKSFVAHYLESLAQLTAIRRLPHIHIHDIRPGFVRTALLGDGGKYPLQMNPQTVARDIVRAIERDKSVVIIDWRYRLLVFFWRLVPRSLWVRMRISSK